MALLATGCTENQPDYEPAPACESPEIYFDPASTTSFSVGETDTEYTVTVYRSETDKAMTYPITVAGGTDVSKFTVPASVSFAAGQKTAAFTVNYVATDLDPMSPYEMTYTVGDGVNTPYAWQRVTYTVTYFPWEDVVGPNGEEYATWTDDFLTTLYNLPDEYLTFDVKLQSSPAIKGLYRVVNPYANCPLFGGDPYDEPNYLYINASDPTQVFICDANGKAANGSTPAMWNWDIYLSASSGIPTVMGLYNDCVAEGDLEGAADYAGVLENGVLKFPEPKSFVMTGTGSELSQGWYYCNGSGNFKIVWPGVVEEADPDDVWESIGTAQYTDVLIYPLYGEPATTWSVEVEQWKKDPTQYRMVNPYKAGVCPDGLNYDGDMYVVLDATNPQCVIWDYQEIWEDTEDPDINGVIEAVNLAANFVAGGESLADIIAAGYGDTFANQTFTFKPGDLRMYFPTTTNDQYKGKLLTANSTDEGKLVLSAQATAQSRVNATAAAMKRGCKVDIYQLSGVKKAKERFKTGSVIKKISIR